MSRVGRSLFGAWYFSVRQAGTGVGRQNGRFVRGFGGGGVGVLRSKVGNMQRGARGSGAAEDAGYLGVRDLVEVVVVAADRAEVVRGQRADDLVRGQGQALDGRGCADRDGQDDAGGGQCSGDRDRRAGGGAGGQAVVDDEGDPPGEVQRLAAEAEEAVAAAQLGG